MSGDSDVTVVTTLVCFSIFCTPGCGCIVRPAFPAPFDFMGLDEMHNSGEFTPRERELISINVIARSNVTKQSSFLFCAKKKKAGLLRFARNDG